MAFKIVQMNPIPPKSNPYAHDLFNMGMALGTNLTVMMANFDNQRCNYLILVNTETGERMRIEIDEPEAERMMLVSDIVNTASGN